MKKTVLFGNGFNQLSNDCPSWHKLLESVSDNDTLPFLEGIPPTLQYEQVYLTPEYTVTLNEDSAKSSETELKEAIKDKLQKISFNAYYETLQKLDVDFFLTTNYDHTFYNNNSKLIKDSDESEKLYSIRRWKKLKIDGRDKLLFFIHGDLQKTASIMLGLDHYGGSLAKIGDYVKGNYQKSKTTNSNTTNYKRVPSIKERINNTALLRPSDYGFKDSGTQILSWIDTFFFTDLHIIGFSLDFSEIDIWWLLSRRARLKKFNLVKNKIFYYSTFPMSEIHNHLPKLRLLERLDVQIVHHNLTSDIQSGNIDYPSIYNQQIKQLKQNL